MKKLALAVLLASSQALAATAWTINFNSGGAVMGEISTVNFTVANTSTAPTTNRINTVVLQLPFAGNSANDYNLDSGVAPTGWVVTTVDKLSKAITFTASSCAAALQPGQSAIFGVRAVAKAASADVTTDDLVANKTNAYDTCVTPNVTFPPYAGSSAWRRYGLSATLSVTPRTLDLNGRVTVTLTVTNRSTQSQAGIAGTQPTTTNGFNFGYQSGATPASLTLTANQTATTSWTFIANQRGVTKFQSKAQNASATSLTVLSADVNVGEFPGEATVTPNQVGTGQTVSLRLVVSNNTTDTYTNVAPNPPTLSGTAAVSFLSGPTPASVSSLPPGGSTAFSWTYRVTGNPGDTFTFTVQASCLRNGLPKSSDPVGTTTATVVPYTLTPNPSALLTGATNRSIAYTVFNGSSQAINKVMLLAPDTSVFTVSGTPFAADTSGWPNPSVSNNPKGYVWTAPAGQEIPSLGTRTFTLSYSSVGPVTVTTGYLHRMELTATDGTTARADGVVTLFISRSIPEVGTLVSLSTSGKISLLWTNPSDHDGVLVVRQAGSPPATAPTAGQQYTVGQSIGSATVVYADTGSFGSSLDDTAVTAGTRYYYRVYNHDAYFLYAPGNAPGSNGIYGVATAGGLGNATWCYNTGFASNLQPMIDYTSGVYSAGNAGFVNGNLSSVGNISDGTEKWRPVVLQGPVQSRFLVVPLANRSGNYIVTGDQSARAWVINAQTGSLAFRGNGGAQLGTIIQAQPAAQLLANQGSNSAYLAAFPSTDLLFFATRDTGAGNRVWALRSWDPTSGDGSAAWAYAPGDLQMINGGMVVDGPRNNLWVASRAGGVGSLRVINTITGALRVAWNVGDVDLPLAFDQTSKQVYVTNNAGVVYGFDATLTAATQPVWQKPMSGALSNYAFPTGNGFMASLSGSVEWWGVSTTDAGTTFTSRWPTPPSMTSAPTGVRIDYVTPQKVYVGDSAGVLHQIDLATGVEDVAKRRTIGFSGLGTPTIFPITGTPRRLFVNSLDGRLCAVELPY